MKQIINKILYRPQLIKKLEMQMKDEGGFPAGHYYSPIPSREEVLTYIKSRTLPSSELIGIELYAQSQYSLLNEYVPFCKDLPFPERQSSELRFYYENDWFSYSDAIFLYCFLRKYAPKRIIEIGSGFSSAVMLDTIDSNFIRNPEVTFIEPYPDRLIRDS